MTRCSPTNSGLSQQVALRLHYKQSQQQQVWMPLNIPHAHAAGDQQCLGTLPGQAVQLLHCEGSQLCCYLWSDELLGSAHGRLLVRLLWQKVPPVANTILHTVPCDDGPQ